MLIRLGGTPVGVCEFVPELGLTQPTVSYHLKQLAEAGLLEREKRGAFVYFRLAPGALERVQALLAGPPVVAAA
jgi:ArsR family transcriptional regulator, arsenate/arsenite/antimonite-responsive transcriptional repressor